MKIFFSVSVAMLLGFVTSSAQAQSDLSQLWNGPNHLNQTVQAQATQVAERENATPKLPVSLIKQNETPPPSDPTPGPPANAPSGTPYFYGGDANQTYGNVDSSNTVAPPCSDCLTNAYSSAMSAPWNRQNRILGAGGLASGNGGQSPWFGGVNGLIFFRNDADEVWLTYPQGNAGGRSLTTRSVDADPFGGVEVNVGRHMNNGYAWMATYWGLFADQDSAWYDGNPKVALPTLGRLTYDSNTVRHWMNNSYSHRVTVQDQFHNFEFNVLNPSCCNGVCNSSTRRFNFLAGFRYFKYNEDFHFGNTANLYPRDDLCYAIETENNLYGFQVGGMGNICLNNRWTFRPGTKLGIYGNHMTHYQRIYGQLGDATTKTGASSGQAYNINSTKDGVSFLGELDLGMLYRFNNNWSANFGYRAVAVTGVAHTADQIPNNFADLDGVRRIDSNGSLILHGIYIGALYNF